MELSHYGTCHVVVIDRTISLVPCHVVVIGRTTSLVPCHVVVTDRTTSLVPCHVVVIDRTTSLVPCHMVVIDRTTSLVPVTWWSLIELLAWYPVIATYLKTQQQQMNLPVLWFQKTYRHLDHIGGYQYSSSNNGHQVTNPTQSDM